jgi:hypothetical protein
MTLGQLITLVVTSATALSIAYQHRKQMRQNELFRLDPSVGVKPAPSPPVAFFKRHWFLIWTLILGVGLPMLGVVLVLARNVPLTNFSAVMISYYFALMIYNLHSYSEMRLLKIINTMIETDKSTSDALSHTAGSLRGLLDIRDGDRKTAELVAERDRLKAELERKKGVNG